MALCCGLKLATWDFGEGLYCRPSSAASCALPGASWHKLPSDLQTVATCVGLGASKERSSCILKSLVVSAGLGVAQQVIWHTKARCFWELENL